MAFFIDFVVALVVGVAIMIPTFMSRAVEAPSGTVACGPEARELDFQARDDQPFEARRGLGGSFCFDDGSTVHYLPAHEENGFAALVYGVIGGVQIANLVLLQGLTGASLGKLMTGLRVVRADGRRAGLGWALVRWLVLIVDGFCCYLPGAVMIFATKGHRRLGDMAAGTFVVGRRDAGQPIAIPGLTDASGYGHPGPTGGFAGPYPAAAPGADGPSWDAARNTYIQFDRNRNEWVEWDDSTHTWRPISR